MILVTVGNATQRFGRLLQAIDDLAASGAFAAEPVIIQSGNNPEFQARHCEVRPFVSMDEFGQLMEGASLIICHGGCGTQLHAIRLGKIPVVMPRREKYGEHLNDHQMQLVEALAAENKIVPAYEPADLAPAIIEARERNKTPLVAQASPMLSLVAQAIEELAGSQRS
jgi:UDP-N-acetylglucosamine transferase subunit ALG13